MQAKTQGELQPEFQAIMDRVRGGTVTDAECPKTLIMEGENP